MKALLCDVGGVLLTNGWEREARERAAEHFGLDWEDFQSRHELVVADFETGRIGLEEYLDRTVFSVPRTFGREEFRSFMWEQSQPYPEALAYIAELADSRKYLLSTLNNESRELNLYRIARFHLTEHFAAFFSSCFLGVRKPDEKIYQLALDLIQHSPAECVFVDDRPENVDTARRLGIYSIQYRNVAQLHEELRRIEMNDSRREDGSASTRPV